jgi:hypothetical protein
MIWLCDHDRIDHAKSHIDRIGIGVNHPDLFTDIKKACQVKQAFFFAFEKGFFVLRPTIGSVLVWVAASYSPVNRLAIQSQIEDLTRQIGGQCIEFWTVRPGFNRVAKALGYLPRPDIWRGVPVTVWRKTL